MKDDAGIYGFLTMIGVGIFAWLLDLRIKAAILTTLSLGQNRIGGVVILMAILLGIWALCSIVCSRVIQLRINSKGSYAAKRK